MFEERVGFNYQVFEKKTSNTISWKQYATQLIETDEGLRKLRMNISDTTLRGTTSQSAQVLNRFMVSINKDKLSHDGYYSCVGSESVPCDYAE